MFVAFKKLNKRKNERAPERYIGSLGNPKAKDRDSDVTPMTGSSSLYRFIGPRRRVQTINKRRDHNPLNGKKARSDGIVPTPKEKSSSEPGLTSAIDRFGEKSYPTIKNRSSYRPISVRQGHEVRFF